jgi:hypothetical protein
MTPGYKTTEFWATLAGMLLVNVGSVAQPVADAMGPKTSAWATAVLGGLYAISRAYTKANTTSDTAPKA